MSVMDLPRYSYAGITPEGAHVVGTSIASDIADRIKAKWRNGWRELSVSALADDREVGGILTNDEGERVWWAEA